MALSLLAASLIGASPPGHAGISLLQPFTDKHEAQGAVPAVAASHDEQAVQQSSQTFNYTMTQQEEKVPGQVDGWTPPPKEASGSAPVKESDYEVYGWWDVDCGLQGQPVCKSFKGDKGWCMVSPLGSANRTMLVPAPRPTARATARSAAALASLLVRR